MIVERCKVNGCTLQHESDGSIRLFEYRTVLRCNQCGAEGEESNKVETIQERTHVCDVCGEPLDEFNDAMKFSVGGSANQRHDEATIEVHSHCVVNAGGTIMAKYMKQLEPEISRGAREPPWMDKLRRLLGFPANVAEKRT